MPNNLNLEFKNNLSDLSNELDAALSWLTPFNLPPDASYVTILALEELATHAIKHGYPDNLEHLIHIEITVEKINWLFNTSMTAVFSILSMFKNRTQIFPSKIAPRKGLASSYSEKSQMI